MSKRQPWGSCDTPVSEVDSDLHELVLGLHWDPPCEDSAGQVADLDAVCAVVDLGGQIVEVVHPGQPRNANGSIVHTGDARTGASEWDDERIFIFLDALPEAVSKLLFVVSSANGVPFEAIPGAQCHVSDRLSERPRVRIDLTALDGLTLHVAAIVSRGVDRWHVNTGASSGEPSMLAELRLLLRRTK
jgi:stress response protein SCP2